VEIAIDLLAIAHRIDELWLLSGSRDLERLLEVQHGLIDAAG